MQVCVPSLPTSLSDAGILYSGMPSKFIDSF
jgi:hypothetical protein